jgi:hypothetical protein
MAFCSRFVKYSYMNHTVGSEERSRYSGSVRAGRLGARSRVGKRYLTPTQTGPGFHMASCTKTTRSVHEGKRPGRGVDHPSLSTVFSWHVGESTFVLLHYTVADFNNSK